MLVRQCAECKFRPLFPHLCIPRSPIENGFRFAYGSCYETRVPRSKESMRFLFRSAKRNYEKNYIPFGQSTVL